MENKVTFDKLPNYKSGIMYVFRNNKYYMWFMFSPEFWNKQNIQEYNEKYIIRKMALSNKLIDGIEEKSKVFLILEANEINYETGDNPKE